MRKFTVKICGINDKSALETAVEAGVAYIGLVFFEKSPRHLSVIQAAELVAKLPARIQCVGLFVDPTDTQIANTLEAVPLDMIQLHGKESPERVRDIRTKFGRAVMKVIALATKNDLAMASDYDEVADWMLFDAKAPEGADRPGGHGVGFDWSLLQNWHGKGPWMLAGGLNANNVATAIAVSGAKVVDVSSGVEATLGQKDPIKIKQFMESVQHLQSTGQYTTRPEHAIT